MGARLVLVGKLVSLAIAGGLLLALLMTPAFGSLGLMARNTADQVTPLKLDEPPLPLPSTILAADGSKIAQFYTENRTPVPLDRVAPIMQKAIVDIEDSRFYQHGPIDLRGTLRALVRNQTSGTTEQGGSSLTQQYVKNVLFETAGTRKVAAADLVQAAQREIASTDRATRQKGQQDLAKARADLDAATKDQQSTVAPKVSRKIQEMRSALWVEEHYSKPQILEKYLNTVFFGNQTNGIEAAAHRYFSVGAAALTLPQAALLAGVVNNQSMYDPLAHPQAARTRRDVVLDRMAQLHTITPEQARDAKATDLGLKPTVPAGGCLNIKPGYGYFCDYVKAEILDNPAIAPDQLSRRRLLNTGGLTIRTTLDPKVQKAAQDAVNDHDGPRSSKVTMEAMVQPGTGRIQAIALSRPYGLSDKKRESTINYAADARHGGGLGVQAGSTFKVFTLAAALQDGVPLSRTYPSPAALSDLTGYKTCDGHTLSWPYVHNADPAEAGTMDLATATWESVNTYYAQLERDVGLCKVAKLAADFGMRKGDGRPLDQVPSFTLGSNDIDIVHEAAAFAGFAAHGKYCRPVAIDSLTDRDGHRLHVPSAGCRQVLDSDVADQVTDVLKGVLTKGTARGQYHGSLGGGAAAKTGTTDNYYTAVFAGYTPDLAATLWRGDPEAPVADPTNDNGASLTPVWEQSMANARP